MNRDRRHNAGNRMSKLLDNEEDCQDEFYKVNYGGFEETETDNEYEAQEDDEDIVDSDFSIDENDEPVSDTEEQPEKKKRRLVTKSYKEPVSTKQQQQPPKPRPKPKPKQPRTESRQIPYEYLDFSERKSIRKTTAAKTAETAQRVKVRNQVQKKRIRRKEDDWVPTQEELLEEAKVTEGENIKSLEKYQQLEDEKKTKKITKKISSGPTILYQSLKMPVIDENDTENEDNNESKFYERTLITFMNDPNDELVDTFFKSKKPRHVPKAKCAITNLNAKYVDPLTSLPYNNSKCFKLIRETYYQQIEAHGDRNNPMVAEWLKRYSLHKYCGLPVDNM